MYLCVWCNDFSSFYDFDIWCWNCYDSAVFYVCFNTTFSVFIVNPSCCCQYTITNTFQIRLRRRDLYFKPAIHLESQLTQFYCESFLTKQCLLTYLSTFAKIRYHDNIVDLFIPNHFPKVCHRTFLWTYDLKCQTKMKLIL